jgi:hypothetical protein
LLEPTEELRGFCPERFRLKVRVLESSIVKRCKRHLYVCQLRRPTTADAANGCKFNVFFPNNQENASLCPLLYAFLTPNAHKQHIFEHLSNEKKEKHSVTGMLPFR